MESIINFFIFTMVFITSWNCNGLCDVDKMKMVFSLFDDRKYDIVALQETHWKDNFIDNYKHLWNGVIYYDSTNMSSKGVAFLVKNNIKTNIEKVKGFDGRYLHIKYKENDNNYDIINVYAPNDVKERVLFFNNIMEIMPHSTSLIIMGDFNNTLADIDRCGKTAHKYDQSYKALTDMMNEHNVVDVWRKRNERKKIFSRKVIRENLLVQSRIDFILITKILCVYVRNIFYVETTMSDHSMIVMNFNTDVSERGPGVWIHNNLLLNDEYYVNKVQEVIENEKQCILFEQSILVWWDNLKYKIKKLSQSYSQNRARERNREYYRIQNSLQRLSERIADGDSINIENYEKLKTDLSEFENEKCRGAILRSKAKWANESDKCTKFFLNLEKSRQESNTIKELVDESGEVMENADSILNLQYDFYSKLYSCVTIDCDSKNQLLSLVNTKLDVNDAELCDKYIDVNEIEQAVKEMARNKSPGPDGLTVEFYRKFLPHLKTILYKLFLEIEKQETLSHSMKMGNITLLYKKKGDKRLLKNWRPISLLNVDYKIIARIMSNRLKQVLPNVISNDQTCCIVGRDIADTLVSIRDIIEMVEMDQMEGYIVKIDQEKAFDRVSHEYLLDVLQVYGFGDYFRKWVKIFYTDIYSSVKNNGHLTKYFPVRNSVRQGCPISALLYVLCSEPLNCAIKCNKFIRGIDIPMCDKTALVFQHADDTTISVCDKKSIFEILNVFELYGRASGARINVQKSEVMCIGTGKLLLDDKKLLNITETNVMKVLGVYFGKNKLECENLNWRSKVQNIKQVLNMWRQRLLTIQGRVNVINTLLMSKLWYSLSVISIPFWARDSIQKECINFLWSYGTHLVSYKTIVGEKENGGLKMDDIYLKMLSFRLKFLAKYLCTRKHLAWKYFLSYFLSRICDLKGGVEMFLLQLNKKDLQCLPLFYTEMFSAWYAVKDNIEYNESTNDVFNYCLFFNPKIVNQNKTLLWKHFIKAGITHIRDISYEVIPGFLPASFIVEMIHECDTEISAKRIKNDYSTLLSIIPKEWENVIQHNVYKKEACLPIFSLCVENTKYDFSSCTVKIFYKLLIQKVFNPPKSNQYWSEKFKTKDTKMLDNRWIVLKESGKPPDVVELDFKIFHNAIFTYEKLFKIGKTDSNKCPLCSVEREDLIHMFVYCTEIQDFKSEFIIYHLETLLKDCENSVYNVLDFDEIFMTAFPNVMKNVNTFFVNFFLSLCRFTIYRRRQLLLQTNKRIHLTSFCKYLLRHYIYYNYHYLCIEKNNRKMFFEKFLRNNPLLKETDGILLFIF